MIRYALRRVIVKIHMHGDIDGTIGEVDECADWEHSEG